MKLNIPTSFMGVDSEEAYERIMNRKEPEQKPIVYQPTRKDTADFIYVPSINLYVAKERTLLNKKWFECQEILHSNNERMPTIPEFIEFLKYCKINHQDIYNEITQKRTPLRGEWLDADFKMKGENLCVNYYLFDANGNIILKSELLDKDTLMEDKTSGISLEDYLNNNHTSQGLPTKNVQSGKLYYSCPDKDNNSVARVVAYPDGSDLSCIRNPSSSSSWIGVRAIKQGN